MKRATLRLLVASLPLLLAPSCDSGPPSPVGGDLAGAAPDLAAPMPDMAVTHAEPPAPGPTMPGDGTASVTVAVSKLYLGDTDWNGVADRQNGWQSYGYDLDGKISSASSTDLCKPAAGAATSRVYPDGNDGIDNSFGKLILPIILGISSDAPSQINASIARGSFTVMLDMQKLGASTDYNPIQTNFWTGGNLGAPPKFDGTDAWPVLSTLVNDGMNLSSGSRIAFPTSYVTNDEWVSGAAGTVELDLSFAGAPLPLVIHHAILTVELDATHRHGTHGVIAGVLDPQDLAATFRRLIGAVDAQQCSGSTADAIATQITQASDILSDGTQDPTRTCDGISVGIGFTAERVQLGAVVPPPPPNPDPCGDGG